jgi:hypothetical protein
MTSGRRIQSIRRTRFSSYRYMRAIRVAGSVTITERQHGRDEVRMTTPPPSPQGPPPSWPQQPKKHRKWPWILLGIFIAFAIGVGACVAVIGGVATEVGNQLNQYAGKTIRYEVTGGSGTAQNVTYMLNDGEEQDAQAALPWSKDFTAKEGFEAFVVTAQNGGSGSISCKIIADGKVLTEKTSNGQYAVVTCSTS